MITTLAEELKSPSRTRRLRALGAASAARMTVELEPRVLKLLADEDHVVRTEAARALGRLRHADQPAGAARGFA